MATKKKQRWRKSTIYCVEREYVGYSVLYGCYATKADAQKIVRSNAGTNLKTSTLTKRASR